MTSADNTKYLTIELFDSKMETFMSTIRLENEKLRNQLHGEIQDVRNEVRVNTAQIVDLQHSVYWGYGILGLIITLAIFFKDNKSSEKKQSLSENEVKNIVRDEFAKLTVK